MMKIRRFILPCMILLVAVACGGSRSDDQLMSSSMPEKSAATARATSVPTEPQAPAMPAATATVEPTAAPTLPPSIEQAILGSWRGNDGMVITFYADGISTVTLPDVRPEEIGVRTYTIVGDNQVEFRGWADNQVLRQEIRIPSSDTMILKNVAESGQSTPLVLRRLADAPTEDPMTLEEGILGTWLEKANESRMTMEFYDDDTVIGMEIREEGAEPTLFSSYEFIEDHQITIPFQYAVALPTSEGGGFKVEKGLTTYDVALPTNDLLVIKDIATNRVMLLVRTAPRQPRPEDKPQALIIGTWSCGDLSGPQEMKAEFFQDGTLILSSLSGEGPSMVGSYEFQAPDRLNLSYTEPYPGKEQIWADLRPRFPSRDTMYLEMREFTVPPSVLLLCRRQ